LQFQVCQEPIIYNRREVLKTAAYGVLGAAIPKPRIGLAAEKFVSKRPPVAQRKFGSHAVEETITRVKAGIGDPELAWMFENCYPNTLDTAIVGKDAITGGRRLDEWAPGRYIYLAMKFSKPFESAEIISDSKSLGGAHEAKGKSLKCVVYCPTENNEAILVKVGISAVSIEGARKNLEAEVPGWDFEGVRRAANVAWERELGKITIETKREDHRKIFYTALYHSLVAPTLFSDVDGQYRGMDLQVHQLPAGAKNYSTYSLWDTYRALHPLYTLVLAERLPDILNTLILMAEQSPAGVPVWPLQAVETGCMIGYHSAPVLAEAYAKGIRGVDYKKAYPLWRKRAMDDDYRGLGYYRKMGFIPCDLEEEAVSKTCDSDGKPAQGKIWRRKRGPATVVCVR
jgi:predicted alpha-1,2-mannosidase